MSDPLNKTVWGHININVANLEKSIAFYELLGFSVFSPGIAYLGLSREQVLPIAPDILPALGMGEGVSARACILQLDDGFPKLDLTEMNSTYEEGPAVNDDLGLVRFCLGTSDLAALHLSLQEQGVSFISEPVACKDGMAEIAVCQDPDGTLIELIQIYPERWPR